MQLPHSKTPPPLANRPRILVLVFLLHVLAVLAIPARATPATTASPLPAIAPTSAIPPPVTLSPVEPSWRGMLREYHRLEQAAQPAPDAPEWRELTPALAVPMLRLGEAFARAAYPADLPLGRRNYHHAVTNLGMAHPAPADLRQFLRPNKQPWPGYTGPTDGNFHMLFNTGTLNLDPADGSSKNHPVKALARQHLGFFARAARVKQLTQHLSATLRAERAATADLLAHPEKRAAFLARCDALWQLPAPAAPTPRPTPRPAPRNAPLTPDELAFLAALLPYVA